MTLPAKLTRDRLTSVIRPRQVAVLGASSKRHTLGNQVLRNLTRQGFAGEVVVVSERAASIEGHPTVATIEDLPTGLDVAMVCIPAPSLPDVLRRLDATGCRAAVVPTAGFSPEQYEALRATCAAVEMTVTGPNCLGILSLADAAPLWTARYRQNVPSGGVAVVAQSGSAAISIMSSLGLGYSRIISSGSELEVTSADYVSWLAHDAETTCIGLVVESIRSPEAFAVAVAEAHRAGKAVVALKVGRSAVGSLAAEAHTGALVSDYDAYVAFFARLGVATVLDYDEMVATLQCFSNPRLPPARGDRVGIVGISGGQTALSCDLAVEAGLRMAEFAPETVKRIEAALPDAPGWNPIDIGASVGFERRNPGEALQAVVDDPDVDSVLVIQDAQGTLPLDPEHTYLTQVRTVEDVSRRSEKPIVIASSSAGDTHELIEELVVGTAVPLVRGLHPALVALRNLSVSPSEPEVDDASRASGGPEARRRAQLLDRLSADVGRCPGPLPHALVQSILAGYEIPFVRSALAAGHDEALALAGEIGFPLVVKVASTEIPHRLEVGGVVAGVEDPSSLAEALARIDASIARAAPHAAVSGYELQQQVTGAVEAIVGFTAAPPFDPMMVVGSGGSLVELVGDRASDLAPVSPERAAELIATTTLGKLLDGYRHKVARTSIEGLAETLHRLSLLADDWKELISEGDLNPVLVQVGSGQVVVVDALLVGRGG
jgi:acyl-CoA synthetase (NDP forming)